MKERFSGVDLARGLAIVGMMAIHLLPDTTSDEMPTLSWLLFAGRSAALFAFVAGISLSFMSGGRTPPRSGEPLTKAAVSIYTRALVITALGLLLGLVADFDRLEVILAYYGMLFLLAIPFLRARPSRLVLACAVTAVMGPLLIHLLLPLAPPQDPILTPSILLQPGTLLWDLMIAGSYPVAGYMVYILAGLAAGRLISIRTPRYAARLLVGGVALAVAAWAVSALLLRSVGGVDGLAALTPGMTPDDVESTLTWGYITDAGRPTSSLWWLAIMAPHTETPLSLLHTLGTAMAVLGACLLVMRTGTGAFGPLIAAGKMPLTIYATHIVLVTVLPVDHPHVNLALQLLFLGTFATWWNRYVGQGPLEKLLGVIAKSAVRMVSVPVAPRG